MQDLTDSSYHEYLWKYQEFNKTFKVEKTQGRIKPPFKTASRPKSPFLISSPTQILTPSLSFAETINKISLKMP